MTDRDALIRHYMQMSDAQFTAFATHEIAGLTPEAIEIVRAEMKRRGTVPSPDAVIDVQLRRLSSEEFERIVTRFREQPCPLCGAAGGLLNGARVTRGGRAELVAGCVPCLEQQLKVAMGASAAVGLLLRPGHGIADALQNEAELKAVQAGGQTQALREYLWANRGEWAHFL
jgi:hypothetical protein